MYKKKASLFVTLKNLLNLKRNIILKIKINNKENSSEKLYISTATKSI
tara:strand:- start:309 stop:452 length:144 start_codon:yes stop_codon:yes gene_type:complete